MTTKYEIKYKVGDIVSSMFNDGRKIVFYADRKVEKIEITPEEKLIYYVKDNDGFLFPYTEDQIDAGVKHVKLFRELGLINE